MTRQRDLGRYQMLWDCPSCGTEKLLGIDHRHCPNCGAAQDPQARYFPDDKDKIAAADHRYAGADKKCPACETPNAAIAHNCVNCGSPLEGAKDVGQRVDQLSSGGGFASDSARRAKDEYRAARAAASAAKDAPPAQSAPGSKKGVKLWMFALPAVLLFGSCVALLFWKEAADIEVTGHHWTRKIEIEEFRAVTDSAWKESVPSGAYDVSCSRAERSTKKVPDGEECHTRRKDLGDGTYKEVEECKTKYRSEPVYDDKCRYKIDRWTKGRELVEEGGLSDEPSWPKVQLARTGNCRGCEREGARTEVYEVEMRDDKTQAVDRCAFKRDRWASMNVGSKWAGERGVITKSLDCDKLTAK